MLYAIKIDSDRCYFSLLNKCTSGDRNQLFGNQHVRSNNRVRILALCGECYRSVLCHLDNSADLFSSPHLWSFHMTDLVCILSANVNANSSRGSV